MKRIVFVVSMAAIMIMLPFGVALAVPGITFDRVVEGTGNYPVDLNNVQAAVSLGGNILLKGTFDFGIRGYPVPNPTPQRVIILKDVGIYGETDDQGNPLTLIKGGFWTFLSPLPSTLPINKPGPRITIQGIHFDGALWAPIYIAYTSGATISGNKITNCVPFGPGVFDPLNAPGFQFSLNAGIIVGPWFIQSGPARLYREGAVTGQLIITDNKIDLENSAPESTLGQGIFVNWTTGIRAKISNNLLENISRNSIEVLDNYLDNAVGSIVMEGNEIITSEKGIPYPSFFTPNGIVFGWWLNPAAYDKTKVCRHTVIHNSIRIKGDTSVGIMAMADESLVLNNKIASEGLTAVGLSVGGSHCLIAHNKIEGTGKYAINVTPAALNALKLDASYSFFQGNNYNLFDAALFELHFAPGADHNVFVGHSGSVLDEGEDNRITNFNFRGKGLKLGTKTNLRGR